MGVFLVSAATDIFALRRKAQMADRAQKDEGTETMDLEANRTIAATPAEIYHANVPDDDMGRRHEEGWGYVLGAIAERFASPPT